MSGQIFEEHRMSSSLEHDIEVPTVDWHTPPLIIDAPDFNNCIDASRLR
jgi:hypothetical protein